MTTRAITIPTQVLIDFCTTRGFEPTLQGRELVFERAHIAHPGLKFRIYTSVSASPRAMLRGDELTVMVPSLGTVVLEKESRGTGEDAIRVSAFFKSIVDPSDSRGVAKTTRVYRTGTVEGVLARMEERLLEATEAADNFLRNERGIDPTTPFSAVELTKTGNESIDTGMQLAIRVKRSEMPSQAPVSASRLLARRIVQVVKSHTSRGAAWVAELAPQIVVNGCAFELTRQAQQALEDDITAILAEAVALIPALSKNLRPF